MELYIGGFAQGKLSYVTNKYDRAKVFDEKNYMEMIEELKGGLLSGKTVVLNHFNSILGEFFEKDLDNAAENAEELTKWLIDSGERYKYKLVIISDETGCGIVPIEKTQRACRECCGRILIKIADRADVVERIMCMLPQKIK